MKTYSNEVSSEFAIEYHAIQEIWHGTSHEVQSLTRRMRSGIDHNLKLTALLKIWGDNCRFLRSYSLNRVSGAERQAYAEALQAFVFNCLKRQYPSGLSGMRYGHESLYQELTDGEDAPDRNRLRVRTRYEQDGPYTHRNNYVVELTSRVAWTTTDALGKNVRNFSLLPGLNFSTPKVIYHSDYDEC